LPGRKALGLDPAKLLILLYLVFKCGFFEMENGDIRWEQRFQNFNKSLQYLEDALQIPNPDILQKAGIIQFFEMSFDLAWNMVKDYLEGQGFVDIKSPRGAFY
jgi:hypothetical protein